MSFNLSTVYRQIQLAIVVPTCASRLNHSVRLNRYLIRQGFHANYASSSSIPIPTTETQVAELLAKASSVEERKQIFDTLLGIEQVRNKLPPTPRGPSGVHLIPIGRTKLTTHRTGIDVHHSPFEALETIYQQTLKVLEKIPPSTVYRQSVESIVRSNLDIVQKSSNHSNAQSGQDSNQIEEAIRAVEKELGVEMIETAIEQAEDELQLASKMIDFKAWQELEDKPPAGQWEYFQVPPSTSYPKN